MSKDFDAFALCWGGILSPVLFKPPDDDRSDRQILLELTRKKYLLPDGRFQQFSLSTFKRKLKSFRDRGVEGLKPKVRSDEGAIRGGRQESLDRAIELKRAQPYRSCFTINLKLRSEGFKEIPESTLQRHLSQKGITVRKLGYEGTIIRKRWSREHTHSMWVGDFSQGPNIIDANGVSHKTWISAFIDVHSRFIVAGIYALNCDMDALVRSLQAAFERHGKPKSLYLDNAKVYRSPVLERACLELGIELIHRAAYDPQGGGIIERFFLTLQNQLERELLQKSKVPLDLLRLNELFSAWIEEVYHRRQHSEIGQTPLLCYTDDLLHPIVPLRPEEVRGMFFNKIQRTVNRDFCDISIDKKRYRVDATLRGDRVEVRYPLGEPGGTVEILNKKGRQVIGEGILHVRAERYVPDPPPIPEDDMNYTELLLQLKRQRKETEGERLPNTVAKRTWDLATFVTKLCTLTGTTTDSLSEADLDVVARVHKNHSILCMKKLQQVWKQCPYKDLRNLLVELGKENS